MASQIEQLISNYRAVSQFSALVAARIVQVSGEQVTLSSSWSQRCLERGKSAKYLQTHLVTSCNIIHTSPIDASSELMSAFSLSGASRAVLREAAAAEGSSKKQHLEIWSDNRLCQVVDLTLLDQHGDVYTSGEFACLEWSPCEQKLLYAAEKKQPKAEPFYPSKPKDKDSGVSDDKLPKKGEENVFREDWGEQLAGKHHPVLCVCDLTAGTVNVLAGIPDTLSAGQALWVPGGIVAVGWSHTPRRLGLVFCTNRVSQVFFLADDGTFTKLSGDGMAVHSPRLSPAGDYLVWLQRPANGPHHACHQLIKQVWGALPHVLVDTVQTQTEIVGGRTFYGLFCHSLPSRCFADNRTLLLSTVQASSVHSYIVNTENGELSQIDFGNGGSLTVLDVKDNYATVSLSLMDTPPSLYLIPSPFTSGMQPVLQRQRIALPDTSIKTKIFSLRAQIKDKVNDFNAIYYGPTDGPAQSVPLILWPHGGPHSSYFETFSVLNQFFIRSGFATLQVNYRGSTGLGQASVDFLPGRAGDTDVKDCHQAALAVLDTFPCLDPKRVVLYGGSHGGFLVTHLSGQYPDFSQAVVALNPVTDLVAMIFTTDIPDWCAVEIGFSYTGREQVEMSPEFLSKLRLASPIQYANKVKAPTLLNIGKKDLRVPPSQGTLYYHTLNTYNIPCKMNLYDDNHSLSTVPVDMDSTINAVLWFLQHLEKVK